MKRLTIIFAVLLTATSIMAEEFKIGKLTFEIETPTTVGLTDADEDITKVFLSDTIGYKGNSYTLTYIGGYAFEGCKSLKSVTIPNCVTSIGDRAFYKCTSLRSIIIPNSVTSIGWEAFGRTALYKDPANWENGALYINNCLIKVDEGFAGHFRIKENTRVIADYAFYSCKSLTSVTIPNSVTSIGLGAFSGCKSLTSVTIPNGVTSIGDIAFWGCKSLKSVTIPNSVTSIGEWAFNKCTSLRSIIIPNSVTRIGWSAFEGTALYNDPANWENGTLYIDDCLIKVEEDFVGHFRIKENTRVISDEAFWGCKSLTSVTIPNSVTTIGDEAFKWCSLLTSVTIPNSVTSIGDRAFGSCSSLTSVTIPNSVTSIGDEAFCYCSSLTSVTIPNSVTSIGEGAFWGCSSLTSMVVASGNSTYDSRDNCNAIIETATNTLIAGCQNTTIPNSVTSIGGYAFEDCSSLTSVRIPNSVTSIGSYAFYGCYSLTSVTIPNSVTSIGDWAFMDCSSLESVTIPNSVTSIGEGAFPKHTKIIRQ